MNPYRGQTFTRMAKALAIGGGDPQNAIAFARSQNWRDAGDVVKSIQMADISPFGTDDFYVPTPAAYDFAEFVRPMTIIGKLVGLRRAPSRVRLLAAQSGSTAYWRGERQARPVSALELTGEVLTPLNVVAIVASTLDSLRSASPNAEAFLSRDLAAATVEESDRAFIDYQNAGVASVKPAAISTGVTPIESTGSAVAEIDVDLAKLVDALSDAGSDLQFATWVMRPRTAQYLARLRGTGGAPCYPGMSAKGGVLLGLPCITSTGVPLDSGSPTTTNTAITLLDASQITVVDDGGGSVELAKHAALQMSSSPGAGAQSLVSLWQTDTAALKVVRYMNWSRCRDGMAQVLVNVSY